MNQLLKDYVAVEGLDKAMAVAKVLVEANKQVMVQLDDCDIYIVAYADNDASLGDEQFAALTPEEAETIADKREDDKYAEAKETVAQYEGEDEVVGADEDNWYVDDDDDDDGVERVYEDDEDEDE